MFNNKKMKDFNPNIDVANIIVYKQLKKYLVISMFIFIIELIFLGILFFMDEMNILKITGIVLVILNLLNAITFLFIFDNGAANKLRKQNFIIEGIKTREQGHTFYYVLKKLGFIRLFVNAMYILIMGIIIMLTFII